jgi:hypothetical protein
LFVPNTALKITPRGIGWLVCLFVCFVDDDADAEDLLMAAIEKKWILPIA